MSEENLVAVTARLPAGLILAISIAWIAHKRGSLSQSGRVAAVVVAVASVAAGWSWAFLLIAFFVTSTILSHIGESSKRSITDDVVAKGGRRDAWQVIANGGVYGLLAIGFAITSHPLVQAAACGALAASTADTWATEAGTLSRHAPRHILTWERVTAGTSGGVTLPGTLAGLLGAAFIGIVCIGMGWPRMAGMAAMTGGFAGSTIDSVLGATVQEKRWCPTCERGTERAIHSCGTATLRAGGFAWLGNDLVNLLSSVAGAIVGSLWFL
ncbi:MAG TPA: DUF92 domain-containing protein [Gemmatimonadaceae bacterium]